MFEESKFGPQRKRLRTGKYSVIEDALLMWFKQARAQNAPISGPLLMEKASTLSNEMRLEFNPNPGWLERFKRRNGIVFKKICGEANQVTNSMTDEWLNSILSTILINYSASDIFNADESGLFFRCLPDKTLAFKGEQSIGGKKIQRENNYYGCC